jgi:hypothetical protein
MDYPIPVAEYTGDQALTIVCESCGAEGVIAANGILNDGVYQCPSVTEYVAGWYRGCAVHMFAEADRCPGCGRLGWYGDAPEKACSRACALQAEYAKTLRGA